MVSNKQILTLSITALILTGCSATFTEKSQFSDLVNKVDATPTNEDHVYTIEAITGSRSLFFPKKDFLYWCKEKRGTYYYNGKKTDIGSPFHPTERKLTLDQAYDKEVMKITDIANASKTPHKELDVCKINNQYFVLGYFAESGWKNFSRVNWVLFDAPYFNEHRKNKAQEKLKNEQELRDQHEDCLNRLNNSVKNGKGIGFEVKVVITDPLWTQYFRPSSYRAEVPHDGIIVGYEPFRIRAKNLPIITLPNHEVINLNGRILKADVYSAKPTFKFKYSECPIPRIKSRYNY